MGVVDDAAVRERWGFCGVATFWGLAKTEYSLEKQPNRDGFHMNTRESKFLGPVYYREDVCSFGGSNRCRDLKLQGHVYVNKTTGRLLHSMYLWEEQFVRRWPNRQKQLTGL